MVGQIIPWNFPLLMLAWKIAPALATGNRRPQAGGDDAFDRAVVRGGVPAGRPAPGVVNIITGDGSAGAEAIVDHPDVDKIAFTGSTEVGKAIARRIAGTSKKATLELGGKAAGIVFDDAPIDQAIEGIVNGIFFNQGQVLCGLRLLVQGGVHDAVIARLKRRLQTLRVGDPMDKNSDLAPSTTKSSSTGSPRSSRPVWPRARSAGVLSARFRRGATGSPQRSRPASPRPTVSRPRRSSGPVLSVPFTATGGRQANNTSYGLSAGVWTEKGSGSSGWPTSCGPASSG